VSVIAIPPARAAARPRVLVVDDSPGIRSLAAILLGGSGYEVVLASSADAALAVLGAESVDVVLTDLDMPGRSGLDLARALRLAGRAMPIVLMTGWEVDGLRAELAALDVALVRKPFAPGALVDAVRARVARTVSAAAAGG
jgi:CheY-like chemotaxis protein